MNQHQIEGEVALEKEKDAQLLQDMLKILWERAQSISELVARLREEKRTQQERERELGQELESLRSAISSREQELKRLRSEHIQLINSNGNNMLTQEEKENLKSKIRDLIAKINSHL